MCGFVAAFSEITSLAGAAQRALDRMSRRGPDGEGCWQESGVVLGHCRLAILDLDGRSAQPMHSACGRYVIVFNGEIYNFRALRSELEADGVTFATTSDTEVLLELFARDGSAMLTRLHGMFAFVIWDRRTRRAFCARDPYGIKPLYVGKIRNGVMVASQVKGLLATGLVSEMPDPAGQAAFWLMGSVPEPCTWHREIQALPAGHYAWIENGVVCSTTCWHDIGEAWRDAPATILPDDEVQARVRAALRETVARHLVADVPVGVFLSGGIDSGAVCGLMVEAGVRNLQGITLTYNEFRGRPEDEAPAAARVAAHYGIRHHVRTVTRAEFEADLPRILNAMDQPSVDGINTWYASKAVAELGLKVVVSGVGGDELFQGYSSFTQLPALVRRWKALARLPGARPLAGLIMAAQAWRSGNPRWRLLPDLDRSLPGAWFLRRGLFAPGELPALMGAAWSAEVMGALEPGAWVERLTGALAENPRLALSQIESSIYLRNQLLRDSDWASMDHSVELRTPLVDAWLLRELQPALAAFQRFPNKRLLAEAPARALPPALIARPKTGFGIPVRTWLRQMGKTGVGDGMSKGWARELVKTAWGPV